MVLRLEFKLKNKSVAFVVAITISGKEVEIPSEKEINHCEESDDYEEKFRMVAQTDGANAIRVESFSCVRRRPKLSRTVDTAKLPEENGKICPTQYGI